MNKVQAFDPTRLTTEYSMNRMPMVDVPGLVHDSSMQGKQAYDLISTEAVNRLILERGEALKIPSEAVGDLAPLLNAALEAADPEVRQVAYDTAHLLGWYFGRLIGILKTGQSTARPEWGVEVWQYWQGIRHIVVGGGLSTGRLGEVMVAGARDVLRECLGEADVVIEQSAFGKWITLVGTACRGWSGLSKARVYDFGGTAVKMGWAGYQNGLLESLQVTSRTHDFYSVLLGEGDEVERGAWVAERMVEQIVADLEPTAAYNGMALAVLISMACYVHDGQPAEQKGYGLMGGVAKRDGFKTLQEWLAWRLEARLGRSVAVGLFHDGTAAAGAYGMAEDHQPQPAVDTAVFVLGTAIGYGFPTGKFRKFSADLVIQA